MTARQVVTFMILLQMFVVVGAGETGSGAERLPEATRKLIEAAFPETDLIRVRRIKDDHQVHVRLLRLADQRRFDLEIDDDAGITEIDEAVPLDELPVQVQQALKKEFKAWRVTESVKESRIRVTYEFEIETKGRKREVTISPRGRVLAVSRKD